MKIAGRSPALRSSPTSAASFNGAGDEDRRKASGQMSLAAASSCGFNGAGDEDRRKEDQHAGQPGRHPAASTEPAMKIAGRAPCSLFARRGGWLLQRSRR